MVLTCPFVQRRRAECRLIFKSYREGPAYVIVPQVDTDEEAGESS